MEAALQDMKNGSSTSRYEEWDCYRQRPYINIDTLKAEEDTISKTLTKLYNKCLSERRIHTAWKNAKIVVTFKKGNKYLKTYRPICILLNMNKELTKVLTKRLENTLGENQA